MWPTRRQIRSSLYDHRRQQQENDERSFIWPDIIHIFAGSSYNRATFTIALHQEQPAPQLQQRVLAIVDGVFRAVPANQLVNPPRLPERRMTAEREFMRRFINRVCSINDQLARHYPFEQTVHWTINLGDGRQYTFHLRLVPRS